MAKYDDASWHYGGDFPRDLDESRACTHIGMFLGWAVDNSLEGDLLRSEFASDLERFRKREITGGQLLRMCCDEKLTDDDLNPETSAFARDYYESDRYLEDYAEVFGDEVPTLYHVEDTWQNYSKIKQVLDRRFADWKASA
jgi:hypothetical protein